MSDDEEQENENHILVGKDLPTIAYHILFLAPSTRTVCST
jgi:hypothetical protein